MKTLNARCSDARFSSYAGGFEQLLPIGRCKISVLKTVIPLIYLFFVNVTVSFAVSASSPGQKAFETANLATSNRIAKLNAAEDLLIQEVKKGNVESNRYLAMVYWHLGSGSPWNQYDDRALKLIQEYSKSAAYLASKSKEFDVEFLMGQLFAKKKVPAEAADRFKLAVQSAGSEPVDFKRQSVAMGFLISMYKEGYGDEKEIANTRSMISNLSSSEARIKFLGWLDGVTAGRQALIDRREEASRQRVLLMLGALFAVVSLFFVGYLIYRRVDIKKRVRNVCDDGFSFRVDGDRKWYSIEFDRALNVIAVRLPKQSQVLHLCPSTFGIEKSRIHTYEKVGGFGEKYFTNVFTPSGQYVPVSVPTGKWIPEQSIAKETDQSRVILIIRPEVMLESNFKPKGRTLSLDAKAFMAVVMPVPSATADLLEAKCARWR
jgi:hypothetical protein